MAEWAPDQTINWHGFDDVWYFVIVDACAAEKHGVYRRIIFAPVDEGDQTMRLTEPPSAEVRWWEVDATNGFTLTQPTPPKRAGC